MYYALLFVPYTYEISPSNQFFHYRQHGHLFNLKLLKIVNTRYKKMSHTINLIMYNYEKKVWSKLLLFKLFMTSCNCMNKHFVNSTMSKSFLYSFRSLKCVRLLRFHKFWLLWQVDLLRHMSYSIEPNGSMLIQPVTKDHQGWWECTATNRVGTTKARTQVFVLGV